MTTLKERRYIWAHNFDSSSSLLSGAIALELGVFKYRKYIHRWAIICSPSLYYHLILDTVKYSWNSLSEFQYEDIRKHSRAEWKISSLHVMRQDMSSLGSSCLRGSSLIPLKCIFKGIKWFVLQSYLFDVILTNWWGYISIKRELFCK